MRTELLSRATSLLTKAGVESSALDAQLLLAHVLGITREELLFSADAQLSDAQLSAFETLAQRRAAREPVSHLLGRREFYGREFAVNAHVLDPRADSETLIEAVLEYAGGKGLGGRHNKGCHTSYPLPLTPNPQSPILHRSILDLGTGSGCLLLTLLAEIPGSTGVGVELSVEALQVARRNALSLGLEKRAQFVRGRWTAALAGQFDIIISNPPYIPRDEIMLLMPEVARFEPKLALDGGKDGLDCYREIANQLLHVLAPGGCVALEIGHTQQHAVAGIIEAAGLCVLDIRHDLAHLPRCIVATN